MKRGIRFVAGLIAIASALLGLYALAACRSWAEALMLTEASNIRQVALAIRIYAEDHGGALPIGVAEDGSLLTNATDIAKVSTANQAFRALFASGIFPDATCFHTPGIGIDTPRRKPVQQEWKWVHTPGIGIDTPPGPEEPFSKPDLLPGQNCFTYFIGRTAASDPSLPLVSGFTAEPWQCRPGRGWELAATHARRLLVHPACVNVASLDGRCQRVTETSKGTIFLPDTNAGISVFALYPDFPRKPDLPRMRIGADIVGLGIVGLVAFCVYVSLWVESRKSTG